MRFAGCAFSREDLETVGPLVGYENITGGIGELVNGNSLMVFGEAIGRKQGQFLIPFFGIGVVFADALAFIGVVNVAQLIVDGDGFDLLQAAVLAELADERGLYLAFAIVFQQILPQISPVGRPRFAAHDRIYPAGFVLVECYTHQIAHILAGFSYKNLNTAIVDRLHVGYAVNAELVCETLGGDSDIHRLTGQDEAVFDVYIIRTFQAGHGFIALQFALQVEYVQAAVLVFVGADDEAFRRIGRVDPYRRIVGIVGDGVGDENRLDYRADGIGLGGMNGGVVAGLAGHKRCSQPNGRENECFHWC